MELQQGGVSIEFELRAKIVSETDPWAKLAVDNAKKQNIATVIYHNGFHKLNFD